MYKADLDYMYYYKAKTGGQLKALKGVVYLRVGFTFAIFTAKRKHCFTINTNQRKWRVVDPKQDARAQGDTSFNCKEEDGPERTFYIAATSTTERDGWLGMLRIIQMIQWLKEETTALHHELHEVMPSLQRVDIDLASFQFLEPNLSALFDPVHLETNDESTTTVVNFRRPPDGSQLKVVRKAYLELVAKHSISSSVRSITFVFYTDKKAHKEGLKRSKDDGSISIIVPCFQGHGIVTEIVEKDIVDFVYEHL